MAPTHNVLKLQREGRLALSKQAIQTKQISSYRRAGQLYNVDPSTLRRRVNGTLPQALTNAKKRKLQLSEEQALVESQIIGVRRMADTLLAARGQNPPPQPVGKNWVSRFINTQPGLQTKWNRKFHSQREKCEDPKIISAWFTLVDETRQAYGILDGDTYNFDETGFMMGVAAASNVVTSSDTIGRAVVVQPGNRKWVTVIEGVNASGWAIPPFVILAGKLHQSGWYQRLTSRLDGHCQRQRLDDR